MRAYRRVGSAATAFVLLLGGTSVAAVINGTNGNEVLAGTKKGDVIRGKGGNDLLAGNKGNDRLIGGPGNDTLAGMRGNDESRGGAGDDDLVEFDPTTPAVRGFGLGALRRGIAEGCSCPAATGSSAARGATSSTARAAEIAWTAAPARTS